MFLPWRNFTHWSIPPLLPSTSNANACMQCSLKWDSFQESLLPTDFPKEPHVQIRCRQLGALCEIRQWNKSLSPYLGSRSVDRKTNFRFWLLWNNINLFLLSLFFLKLRIYLAIKIKIKIKKPNIIKWTFLKMWGNCWYWGGRRHIVGHWPPFHPLLTPYSALASQGLLSVTSSWRLATSCKMHIACFV